ncbi:MAG: hypothetical protein L3J07_01090 [Candidatus Magasanikbacteria bacterium]|nr:hypothetical protein [Candidatus Magasanikbacteria bacterium]
MVAVLAVLFTIGAIIAAIIIHLNNKKHKQRTEDFFKEQEIIYKKRQEEIKKDFDILIKVKEKEYRKAEKKDRKEIKKEIIELKKDKISIGFYRIPEAVEDSINNIRSKYGVGYRICKTKCFGCKENFQYKDETINNIVQVVGSKKVFCPYCGAENFI